MYIEDEITELEATVAKLARQVEDLKRGKLTCVRLEEDTTLRKGQRVYTMRDFDEIKSYTCGTEAACNQIRYHLIGGITAREFVKLRSVTLIDKADIIIGLASKRKTIDPSECKNSDLLMLIKEANL